MKKINERRQTVGRRPLYRHLGALTVMLGMLVDPRSPFACTRAAEGMCLPTTCSFGLATFGKLTLGMSPLQAARVLGCEGRRETSSNAYGVLFEIYRFNTKELGSGALLDFHNSKLTDMVPIDLH